MKLDELFLERLETLSWFCKCGTPSPLDWTISAASPKEARKAIASAKWENMVLEKQGDVTEQLSIRSAKGLGKEYREWNALVEDFKNRWLPSLKKQWETALAPSGLDTAEVLNDVSFNVLSIAVIDAYKELVPVPPFFLRLLEVYEVGYLPCGWKGKGDAGKMMIY